MAQNMYNKEAMDGKFQEKLIAGSGINIAADGKTISATGTSLEIGNGLEMDSSNKLAVKPKANGGIAVAAEGVSLATTEKNKLDLLDGDTETINFYGADGTVVATVKVPTATS